MITLRTKKGQPIYVDDIDADLAKYKWYLDGKGRAFRNPGTTSMSRLILARKLGRKLTQGETCDHIDLHKTNNQRYNLRVASYQEQNANRRKHKHGVTSPYKSVSWDKDARKWRAVIWVAHTYHFIGRFTDEKEAARAYDAAALQHFGKFARLNNV